MSATQVICTRLASIADAGASRERALSAGGRLAGKVAVVSGTACGIGRGAVDLFAAGDAQVLAVDRDTSRLAGPDTAATIATLSADLTDAAPPEHIAAEAQTRFGGVDILFDAQDESDFITGQGLVADGGLMLRL